MNVLNLLKKDHSAVKSLIGRFDRVGKTDLDKRTELFVQIRRELQIHSRAEEEIFYPALKALNDEGRRLALQAVKEYADVDQLLLRISRLNRTDEQLDELFETLAESVDIPVIASGGISDIEDVKKVLRLASHGVIGMITGRALYEGTLDLEAAIRATKEPVEKRG